VNPDVQLVPLKICTSSGFCPSYAVIRALEYASEQDIDILNMSLGGRGNPSDHAICAAIDAYTQNGGLVVAAAGNSDIDTSLFVP
jgi:subtilisin